VKRGNGGNRGGKGGGIQTFCDVFVYRSTMTSQYVSKGEREEGGWEGGG
jgi:hypothetical protein